MDSITSQYLKLFLLAALCVACGCPKNDSGITTQHKWVAHAKAACAAVEGCDLEYMLDIPVYEQSNVQELDICGNHAIACFCINPGCPGAIVATDHDVPLKSSSCPAGTTKPSCFYPQDVFMLHEYVHAAYHSIGADTEDHPSFFDPALQRALKIYNASSK